MKKGTLILFVCFAIIAKAQDKPRKFVKTIALCPIDISKISTQTLEEQSTIKIESKTVLLKVGDRVEAKGFITENKDSIKTVDTTYKYYVLSQVGLVFSVEQQVGSFSIIKIWDYSKQNNKNISEYSYYDKIKNTLNANSKVFIPIKINGKRNVDDRANTNTLKKNGIAETKVDPTKDFYLVKTDELLSKSEEFEYKQGTLNVGIMFLPIKLRPFSTNGNGNFDFTSELNLGTGISFTAWHNIKKDYTTNIVLYTGISSTKIDSALVTDSTAKNYRQAQNTTVFSPALGLYWEKKGIQIGFLIGMDFPTRNLQKSWVYRNMPWISLSAGISIFKLTNNTSTTTGNNKQ